MRHLAEVFDELMAAFPEVDAVNLGGGIPHAYRPGARPTTSRATAGDARAVERLSEVAGRRCASKSSPAGTRSRAWAAGGRVKDVKATRTNQKGPGHQFIMTDAGFNDLIRPAMYGSYHKISIVGQAPDRPPEPFVVAGPLCESGDVFTRDEHELLEPRDLPRPEPGDLWSSTMPAPTARL